MASEEETNSKLSVDLSFNGDICKLVISGELDWTNNSDSGAITKCLEQIWSTENVNYLELDCRDLYFSNNDGAMGTYFLAVMIELKEKARQQHIRLFIRLKSREQASLLNLWGNKMWRKFRRHFIFDDPVQQ